MQTQTVVQQHLPPLAASFVVAVRDYPNYPHPSLAAVDDAVQDIVAALGNFPQHQGHTPQQLVLGHGHGRTNVLTAQTHFANRLGAVTEPKAAVAFVSGHGHGHDSVSRCDCGFVKLPGHHTGSAALTDHTVCLSHRISGVEAIRTGDFLLMFSDHCRGKPEPCYGNAPTNSLTYPDDGCHSAPAVGYRLSAYACPFGRNALGIKFDTGYCGLFTHFAALGLKGGAAQPVPGAAADVNGRIESVITWGSVKQYIDQSFTEYVEYLRRLGCPPLTPETLAQLTDCGTPTFTVDANGTRLNEEEAFHNLVLYQRPARPPYRVRVKFGGRAPKALNISPPNGWTPFEVTVAPDGTCEFDAYFALTTIVYQREGPGGFQSRESVVLAIHGWTWTCEPGPGGSGIESGGRDAQDTFAATGPNLLAFDDASDEVFGTVRLVL